MNEAIHAEAKTREILECMNKIENSQEAKNHNK